MRQLAEKESILLILSRLHNITYRQLNSDITTRKATFDLHRMCELQLFEQKGQKRNTYYVAGQEFIGLNSTADNEMCRADDEMCRADDLNSRADGLNSRADSLNSRADGLNSRVDNLPMVLKERIERLGKRTNPQEMEELIVKLCDWNPLSLSEIAIILNRKAPSIRYLYLNKLITQGKLFYTIPEMLNHPRQKYTTKKKQ